MEGVNDAFKKAHIPLPLPTATTVTDKNRREAGEQMVMKLNGDRMKQILSQVAKDEYDLRVNDLYDFCFGDFYTRSGLTGRTHQKLSNEPRYRSPFIGDLTRGTF